MTNTQGTAIKIAILWLAILLMGSFWLTTRANHDTLTLTVMPKVLREGEPIIATIKLSNPTSQPVTMSYQLHANGELVQEGITIVQPATSKIYQYTYRNPFRIGEQVTFVTRLSTPIGEYEEVVSLPGYPPQVLSSFVSFASFSTSLMSSMSSLSYYQATFGTQLNAHLGLLFTIVLMMLLIFLELSQPVLMNRTLVVLNRMRIRFNVVTWVLFTIFMGIMYTNIVIIISNV